MARRQVQRHPLRTCDECGDKRTDVQESTRIARGKKLCKTCLYRTAIEQIRNVVDPEVADLPCLAGGRCDYGLRDDRQIERTIEDMHVMMTVWPKAHKVIIQKVTERLADYAHNEEWAHCHIHIYNDQKGIWWMQEYKLPFQPVGHLFLFPESQMDPQERYYLVLSENRIIRKRISDYPHPDSWVNKDKIKSAPKKKHPSFETGVEHLTMELPEAPDGPHCHSCKKGDDGDLVPRSEGEGLVCMVCLVKGAA